MENLWPDFGDIPSITSPKSILLQQVRFLEEMTHNLLTGRVQTHKGDNGKIVNSFDIVAPLLKNYSYTVLYLVHDAISYPCEISFLTTSYEIKNEEQLIEQLRAIFSTTTIKQVIVSLIGQSKDEEAIAA